MNHNSNTTPFRNAYGDIVLPLLSGLLLGSSFPTWPGVHLELLAWVALVPLLVSVEAEQRFGGFFRKVWTTTFVACLISLWWVCLATLAGGLLTVVVQSLFSTVPLLLFFLARKRAGVGYALLSLPFIWTGWEWAYMQQDLSFGWLTLGNSQANLLWMVQYADITGVWGISFWLLVFNVLAFLLVSQRRWSAARSLSIVVAMLLMVLAPLAYAWLSFGDSGQNRRTVRVALVQPDIDPHLKWAGLSRDETMQLLFRLTGRKIATDRVDLVLWPETAVPFTIRDAENAVWMSRLRQEVDQWRTPLLTGFPDRELVLQPSPSGFGASASAAAGGGGRQGVLRSYNASMLVQPGAADQIYRKMRLVPFGERVPYSDMLPFLEQFSFSLSGISSWDRGRDATVLSVDGGASGRFRIANIICYESIFPGQVAQFVSRGAQLLTLVTNDGWYGTSYGPWQHAAIGRLRCIENRRAMARCANTGVTLCYDRFGRTTAEVPWWQRDVLIAEVPLEGGLTWYTAHPDAVAKAALGVALLLLLGALFRRSAP